jgi:hypothetical protein
MRTVALVLISIGITFEVLFGVILRPYGSYNHVFDAIDCKDRASCLHEVGHKADAYGQNISQSEIYRHDIDLYRLMLYDYPQMRDGLSYKFYTFPGLGSIFHADYNPLNLTFWQHGWGGYTELYASVVEWSDGDPKKCPRALRDFYDWEFINAEMEKLGYGG